MFYFHHSLSITFKLLLVVTFVRGFIHVILKHDADSLTFTLQFLWDDDLTDWSEKLRDRLEVTRETMAEIINQVTKKMK